MVPTEDKIRLIDALSETGLQAIEITSFVNPKWIPQLADGAEVSKRIVRKPGIVYSALVPNRQGRSRAAQAAGMREVAVFMSASETHNKKNVNKRRSRRRWRSRSATRCRPRWRRGCAFALTSRPSTAVPA